MLINVIGWTTCRPFAMHQRSRALFRDGTSMPGPPKDSAEAINACRSRLLSRMVKILVVRAAPRMWLANCYFSTPKHCYIPSQRARIALVVVDLKGIRAG
jgi:hypothetical protein